MRYFFLYSFSGAATLYIVSGAFVYGISFWWSIVVYFFMALYLAAANISLFRKKIGAAFGLIAFSCVVPLATLILGYSLFDLDAAIGEMVFVLIFGALIYSSVYYSYKLVFKKPQLDWSTVNQLPLFFKLVLFLIQGFIAYFWIFVT